MIDPQLVAENDWITIKEAAALTGDSENHLQQLIRSSKIKTRRRARSVLIQRSTLLTAHHKQEQSVQSLSPSQAALAAIEQMTAAEQQARNAEAIRLVSEWTNATGDEADDQYDTLAYLLENLDEHRASERKIFPPELKEQLTQLVKRHE